MRRSAPLALVLLLTAPAASAQLVAGPNDLFGFLSEDYELFLHTSADVGLQDAPIYSCDTTAGTLPCSAALGTVVFDLPLDPPLEQVATISGPVEMEAFISAWVCDPGVVGCFPAGTGQFEVSAQLLVGTEVVATGEAVEAQPDPLGTATASWSVTPTVTVLDPAKGNIHWTVTVTTATAGTNAVGLQMAEGAWSHVSFDVAGLGPATSVKPVHRTVATPAVDISDSFTTATNVTYVYNWTAPEGTIVSTLAAAPTAGSATITVRDASGATVQTAEVNAATNLTKELTGAAGNWTVTIAYSAFKGTLDLDLAAKAASTGTSTSQAPTSTSGPGMTGTGGAADGSGSTSSTQTEESTPGLGPVALLLAFAVVVGVVRRRLE